MKTITIDLRQPALLLLVLGALYFAQPRFEVREVDLAEARTLIDAGALVIDVRERAGSASAHLPGALLVPLETLGAHLPKLEAAKDRPILVYCGDGSARGPQATQRLNQAGFARAVNMKGGFERWRAAGLPVSGA